MVLESIDTGHPTFIHKPSPKVMEVRGILRKI